ncbi:MAG: hypothetical protein AAF539_13955 [Planctomycetota bacterium]
MRLSLPKLFGLIAAVAVSVQSASQAHAQFEWAITGGSWTAFLPEYQAVHSDVDNAIQLDADQNDIGGRIQAHGFYHFEPTRTVLEMRASLAGADIDGDSFSGLGTVGESFIFAIPGIAQIDTNAGQTLSASVRSRTIYNDAYIGLRDKFDLSDYGLGPISLGCGFSHMNFDNDFNTRFDIDTPLAIAYEGRESLQSSYIGGEIVGSMLSQFFGRDLVIDMGIGIYDLEADYEGQFTSVGAQVLADSSVTESFSDVAYQFKLSLTTVVKFAGVEIHPTTGIQYISSLPGIVHGVDSTTSIRDDDAFLLNGGWEFVF